MTGTLDAAMWSVPATAVTPATGVDAVVTGHGDVGKPWFPSVDAAWQAMAVPRGAAIRDSREIHHPALGAAADLVAEALYRLGASGRRRVPSAGAIYPYATLVLAREDGPEGRWAGYHVNSDGTIDQATLHHATAAALADRIAARGGPLTRASPDAPAHILVLTRPWLSIRKYGPRGYLYAHLDAAHAATNLLGVARSRGPAHLILGLSGEGLQPLLPFHEPFAVVTIAPRDPQRCIVTEPPQATARDGAADLERVCWSMLGVFTRRPPIADRCIRLAPVIGPEGAPIKPLSRTEWADLSRRRRSAKHFAATPLHPDDLTAVLGSLSTALPTDLPGRNRSSVGITAYLRSRGTSNADTNPYARIVYGDGDVSEIVAACSGQRHLAGAQAFLLLHAKRSALLGCAELFGDAVFRAGAAGQLIYLGATRAGVAVSAVGGFDPRRWSALAELPDDHELLYLLVLGTEEPAAPPNAGPERRDRAEPAHAHGERG